MRQQLLFLEQAEAKLKVFRLNNTFLMIKPARQDKRLQNQPQVNGK